MNVQNLKIVSDLYSCIVIFPFIIFQVGERIRVILDCEDNTLAFEKNYEFLGKLCLLVPLNIDLKTLKLIEIYRN